MQDENSIRHMTFPERPADRIVQRRDADGEHLGRLNARATAIAWLSIFSGAASGLIMGLWAFDGPFSVPDWIGDYDALPRRFLRLAHVAMFALGVLHIALAGFLHRSRMAAARKQIVYRLMAMGNILMPGVLIGAAIWAPLKYLSPVPALALSAAFGLAAVEAVRAAKGP